MPEDNPPIGIILSKEKEELLVEYATYGMDSNLFVSKYELYLPNRDDLKRLVERITLEDVMNLLFLKGNLIYTKDRDTPRDSENSYLAVEGGTIEGIYSEADLRRQLICTGQICIWFPRGILLNFIFMG